ncbi:hypothetical protein [Salimicrobium halophilum]|uniref:Glycine zipper-like domain-containing protein n=1 Tax=Salimicrobium halophilum TaxID=86666 RepID=A0A1G8UWJ5_9BACI|nr:hypothetical protein [Salimicrobium halophilum]SDJ57290.1 hypothetical protein SAMN04490247_2398 [Salimicrobium halophilum]
MADRIDELRKQVDLKTAKKLELEKVDRIMKRLEEFSPECETCANDKRRLAQQLDDLLEKNGNLEKNDIEKLKKVKGDMISHLQKVHKMVPEGQNVGLFMAIGISIGTSLGLVVFENMAIGISLGLAMGVAVGSGKDAEAKKKGLTI